MRFWRRRKYYDRIFTFCDGGTTDLSCDRQEKGVKPKDRKSYKEILPEFLDKECEINVNKPLFSMDVLYTMRGRMVDLDDEWLMLEQVNKKKKVVRVFRTELVSGIKEIKD